ncbi:MAG: glycosyltransferase family 4 protein [Thiohalomonadales bacterium]
MTLFFYFITSSLLTMILIPPLNKYSRYWQMLDTPGERKVHVTDVARVGGIAMVVGAVLPILFWSDLDNTVASFLLGIMVILFFGVWDDRKQLGYKMKFLGQAIAVSIVVFYGDISISHLPIVVDYLLPTYIAYPLTFFALLGVTNAINLADGLDGLAGGTTLLSLGVIVLLCLLAGGSDLMFITAGIAGSVLGFLRFNTYPAVIFMGDAGSQFLGFSVGVLSIMLIEHVNTAVSVALPLLLLGLPLLDTLIVMAQRVYEGRSPFKPDSNHIHHKLLAVGFDHYEAVGIIYVVQGGFVASAYFLRYQSDALILGVYLAVSATIIGFFYWVAKTGWRIRSNQEGNSLTTIHLLLKNLVDDNHMPKWAFYVTTATVSLYLLQAGLLSDNIPFDVAILSLLLCCILFYYFFKRRHQSFNHLEKMCAYVACTVALFLTHSIQVGSIELELYNTTLIGLLTISIIVGIRFSKGRRFDITPLDILALFIALIGFIIMGDEHQEGNFAENVLLLLILFYGVELIVAKLSRLSDIFRIVLFVALAVVGVRGMMLAS